MAAKWPAFGSTPKGSKLDNDKNHGHTDPNSGGGPTIRKRQHIPNASRGGPYQSGQRSYGGSASGNSRGPSGNPASRGGAAIVSMQPDDNNPNPGGAPGMADALGGDFAARGGTLAHGQAGVPGGHNTNVPAQTTRPGNTGGKMHRRIAGHFNNKSKGTVGSYGKGAIS